MNCFRSITAVATLLALSVAAGAQTIPDSVGKSSSGLPAQLQNVGFEPKLNTQLPLDLNFRDESGRAATTDPNAATTPPRHPRSS